MNGRRQTLWDLLASASRVEASPGFAQKVTQRAMAVRQHSESPALSLSATAAALLVLGIATAVLLIPAQRSDLFASQESCTEEFEKIVLMDELLAVNDPTQLDDEAVAKLLFR